MLSLPDAKWDNRFLDLACLVGSWSKDPSTKCGAVIVRPDRTIASVGYNGFPSRVQDDSRLHEREVKYDLVVHGEMNALLHCQDKTIKGYTLYTTPFLPCVRCAVHFVEAGIARVVAPTNRCERWESRLALTRGILSEAGVLFAEIDYDCGEERRPDC